MTQATLIWPVNDPDIRWYRALGEATLDIPRIMAENHWQQIGQPSDWRFEEGIDNAGHTLYLRCELEVLVVPRAFRETG